MYGAIELDEDRKSDDSKSSVETSSFSYSKYLTLTLLVALVIIFGITYNNNIITQNNIIRLNNNSKNSPNLDVIDDSCVCPSIVTEQDCYNADYPVLGGVDFVNYFINYKNEDGTYDESRVGEIGSSDYSSVYNGYTFYFTSQSNKELFDLNPTAYIPQYGGFCAWGMTEEYGCPRFSWAADCLGPNGNWAVWTIQNGKLYFFLKESVKDEFLQDPNTYIANGDNRWSGWYPDTTQSKFSTNCYSSTYEY